MEFHVLLQLSCRLKLKRHLKKKWRNRFLGEKNGGGYGQYVQNNCLYRA